MLKPLPTWILSVTLSLLTACASAPQSSTGPEAAGSPPQAEPTAQAETPLPAETPATEPPPKPELQDPVNTYYNAEVGFSITKPINWFYSDPDVVKRKVDKVRLGDDELEKLVRSSRAPLVVIARNPLNSPPPNPNVIVT
ncbi:MAG: hypothetical protein GWM98_25995, partial [Nitrospinaceae bacterium]|nr:hypothetical protein [Nitrospinaceae bacterium]NIR53598.1 hypothetical protein [Nitrospinaceae bacterium]NIS84001.1 hypothetical protein [Nitrospinaceae bacterium]NIT84610.1 hypothetical protein [Nitrospinaceae bacterium]NIU43114.1 hypothetical protein [Nitrospinaceae bacterium]